MSTSVYFDHNATTMLDSRVLEAMLPYLRSQQGNPTSRHGDGRAARQAVEHAREQVAAAVGAHPSQVTFTSGGTEADNMAIKGIAATHTPSQIAVSGIEHPAVLEPARALLGRGWKIAKIGVNAVGQLDLDQLARALQQKTALVSVMAANNETGVLQEIAAVAELAKRHGSLVHTDAVQALGKIPLDFNALGINAMSLSSHKINGPQGAGALILDKRVDIQPLQDGGGQEKGLRSGTENIAAIVGFGLACELATRGLAQHAEMVNGLRTQLEQGLTGLGAVIFGENAERLHNTSFFAFPNIEGETLVMALDRKGFAVASGSACSSDSTEPSHVLMAMGVETEIARGAVRVSLGMANSAAQVADFLLTLQNELSRMKRMAAVAV
ncbi:cysteine desulfurase NifS [mine drainage metagenome]|uniref:Cysteine desulfurase NifS n=1 Tax=mine drainage metagenome TaxID=410659 RepID=A0A1J5QZW8_9ZZZZ